LLVDCENALLAQVELKLQGRHDPANNLILERKNIPQWPVVALRPQIGANGCIYQLRRYAYLVAGLVYAALQYVLHSQFAADVLHFCRFALVGEA
jgi:hypothetical protein